MAETPSVVVVGGGATGVSLARDLAMRGVDTTLLEQGSLAHGTTGHTHGVLHSGARYADSDPATARACIGENRILREIAPACVSATGGLFAKRPVDSGAYFEEKVRACGACDIPATVLTGAEAREREPALADSVERAIRVPSGVVDPFRLVSATARAALDRGARIETFSRVTDVAVEDRTVTGVTVERRPPDDRPAPGTGVGSEVIDADHVVNATGPWCDRVAALAGVALDVRRSRGVMTTVAEGGLDTVVHHCRPRDDGDILVPLEASAVLGTTHVDVEDPAAFPREQWEVETVVDSLSALVPRVADATVLRSDWGVRALFDPGDDRADPAGVTRDHAVLDHAARDGLAGLTTVVGGKVTTARGVAAQATDHVCDRLGVEAGCRTDEVPLPEHGDPAARQRDLERFGLSGTLP